MYVENKRGSFDGEGEEEDVMVTWKCNGKRKEDRRSKYCKTEKAATTAAMLLLPKPSENQISAFLEELPRLIADACFFVNAR